MPESASSSTGLAPGGRWDDVKQIETMVDQPLAPHGGPARVSHKIPGSRSVGFKSLKVLLLTALVAASLAGCGGSSSTTTVVETSSPAASSTAAPSSSSQTDSSSSDSTPAPAPPQIFHGSGQQDLGTITVPADSTISWNCPSCASTNFIINNAHSDPSTIATNGLDQTQGVDPIAAGVYHTVVVDTSGGPWTVAIGITAPTPTSGPAASGSSGAAPSPPPSSPQSTYLSCDANIAVSGASRRVLKYRS